MKIILGSQLSAHLQAEILRRFVHRWTFENARQTYGGQCPGCEQSGTFPRLAAPKGKIGRRMTREEWHAYHAPLVSDAEWLNAHAFHVTAKGELSEHHHFAEPACMAKLETV